MNELLARGYPKFEYIPNGYERSFTELILKSYERFQVANYGWSKDWSYFLSAKAIDREKVDEFLIGLVNLEVYNDWNRRPDATDDDLVWHGCIYDSRHSEYYRDITAVFRHYNMSHMVNDSILNHPIGQVW